MRAYRKLLRAYESLGQREEQTSVRDELGVEENWLVNFIQRMKLAYFGHVKRRHECMTRSSDWFWRDKSVESGSEDDQELT